MIKRLLIAIVAVVLLVSCAKNGPRKVDYPNIGLSNTSVLDVAAVELTDSNTVIHLKAYYRPNYWIQINGDTYLEANGEKYALTGTEGIEPDTHFWMPDSGKAEFALIFEPLPFETEKFNLREPEDVEGAWFLGDINISGKEIAKYPEGLPEELKSEKLPDELQEPKFELGQTTVNFHLLPHYDSNLTTEFNLYVNSLDGRKEEIPVKFDETGNATVQFDQYGTASTFLVGFGHLSLLSMSTQPGETIDAYIDLRQSGKQSMDNRDNYSPDLSNNSLHTGQLHGNDLVFLKAFSSGITFLPEIFSGDFAEYNITSEEFMALLKDSYFSTLDSINAHFTTPVEKEYVTLYLQDLVLRTMSDYRYFLTINYHKQMQDGWNTPVPEGAIVAQLNDEDYKEVTKWFDINNPKLLLIASTLGKLDWNKYDTKGDLSRSLKLYREAADKAKHLSLSPADIDTLRTLSNPFFATAIDSLAQRTQRKYDELASLSFVSPTPQVADDKVFDAIIAPHKGKVVVVDLWNTWCGPCRAALKANEPVKTEGELANNDDIVWIYLADESSEYPKYLQMIPEIKGLHYYLNTSQIEKIRERFNVDGIPYYILVDRNGKAEGRPDLRYHSKYVKSISQLL